VRVGRGQVLLKEPTHRVSLDRGLRPPSSETDFDPLVRCSTKRVTSHEGS